jgi:hypothetical protein
MEPGLLEPWVEALERVTFGAHDTSKMCIYLHLHYLSQKSHLNRHLLSNDGGVKDAKQVHDHVPVTVATAPATRAERRS